MAVSASDVQKAYIAFFNRPADPLGLSFWMSKNSLDEVINAFSGTTEYTSQYSGLSNAQIVNQVYQNLFGRDAETDGLVFWANHLQNGTLSIGNIALTVLNSAGSGDATVVSNKVTAATAFTTALDTAAEITAYTGTAAAATAKTWLATVTSTAESLTAAQNAIGTTVTTITTTGGAQNGSTFTLTSGVDSLTGTAGGDTFVGTISGTASNNLLATVDTIAGGDGNDTLSVTALDYADDDAFPVPTTSSIETLTLRAVDATAADDIIVTASNFSGLTTFNNDRSTSNVQINSLASGTVVNVIGNGTVTNADTAAAYGSSVTTGTLNIQNGTTAGAIAMNGTGLTTLAISSTGAANTVGAISSNSAVFTGVSIAATTALTTGGITIGTNASASETLTITGAAADRSATATAAAHSAVVLGALDNDFTSIDASGLTAGGVSATLSGLTTATFTGGAGNDQITTSTVSHTGTVNAGSGTDTLIVAVTGHLDSTTEGAVYQGFEILQVNTAAAVDMDHVTGSTITGVYFNDTAGAVSVTDMNATQAANVTFLDINDTATIGVKNATQVGTTDTLTITISDLDTTTSETLVAAATDGADWTVAGVETINLVVVDDFDADSLANITGMTRLAATGGGDVDIITGAVDMGANGAIDFSGLTGTVTFNATALATNAFSYLGSSGVDTVTSNVIGGSIISTGAGNDVITVLGITGGTAGTTVTGGAGADQTTLTVIGNAANEAVTFVYAAGDSVSDSSTTGISATLTDNVVGIDTATLADGAGNLVTFDTNVSATAVTAGTTDVVLGTTTVTNAGDFFVNIDAADTTYIYQDTDGDRIIEAGEFAVQLTGITTAIMAAGEFSVASGNLVYTAA